MPIINTPPTVTEDIADILTRNIMRLFPRLPEKKAREIAYANAVQALITANTEAETAVLAKGRG